MVWPRRRVGGVRREQWNADTMPFLRLLCRGSANEERLAELWRQQGNYEGAEASLDEAILQDQIIDNHRETSHISVMTMQQLKGQKYDSVLLVEDQHRSFRGREKHPPYMETKRLLRVSLTRARHFATGERDPDPLTETWGELTSAQATVEELGV